MRHLITLFSLILIILVPGRADAQTKTGKLSGRIGDAGQSGIQSATIALLKASDSAVVKMAAAGKVGHFEFDKIAAGRYLVLASAVGYEKTYSKVVEIGDQGATVQVEPLVLKVQSKDLSAVTVNARKPLVEHKTP